MQRSSEVSVAHVVVKSSRPYAAVKAAVEAHLPSLADVNALVKQLAEAKAPWDEIRRTIEQRMGPGAFSLFAAFDQGQLLGLAGKPGKATQYVIGNPLLAIQMIEHEPQIALYAPLRLAVYETADGTTCVSYDSFTSLVGPYRQPAVAEVAAVVQRKLEELVAAAVGEAASH
jgi:uncharacterized protein (DUF302 family)